MPQLLDYDLDWRKLQETVFYFPFDHRSKLPEVCHAEVRDKLSALEFPVLFLSNLDAVSFEAEGITGRYTKDVTRTLVRDRITAQWLSLTLIENKEESVQRLIVFTRESDEGHPCSIGFAFGDDGRLVPIDRTAFCFFPTKETTNLNFMIHAPFLLTDSREGIKAGNTHNQELVRHLALLAADCLPILRDEKLINDSILDIIPYDETKFSSGDDKRKASFKPFYTTIKDKFRSDTLLPAAGGQYASKESSYWASDAELVELFSDEQLAQLTETKDAKWVFTSRGRKEIRNANRVLADYIDGADGRTWYQKSNLIVSSLDPAAVLQKITASYIKKQTVQWLHKFYAYLSERVSYQKFVKERPIFLDQLGSAVSAFDQNGQLVLFLPCDAVEGYKTVKKDLLANAASRAFIESFGIKKPSLRDEIYNKILPAYDSGKVGDSSSHFMKLFRYFKECRNEEVADFIAMVKNKEFLRGRTAGSPKADYTGASDLYWPSPDLHTWFEASPETKFLLLDEYLALVDGKEHEILYGFFKKLEIPCVPKLVVTKRFTTTQEARKRNLTSEGRDH